MTLPTEDTMRTQMHSTMVALEAAAKAVTAHFGGGIPAPVDGVTEIKGTLRVHDLEVMGCHSAVESEISDPLGEKLDRMDHELEQHQKALAIIGTFGVFQEIFFSTNPKRAVHSLVGLQSCTCVGTGWVARDEQCETCKTSGYLKA